ncbi:MAG: hypothetical protein JF626_10990 [Polaromonas sp.]|nr:hypothetical protein [Polaromonas sp.]
MSSKPSSQNPCPANEARDLLIGFNEKVTRLEATKFFQRYKDEPPNIILKFNHLDHVEVEPAKPDGSVGFSLFGYVEAWVEDFDQDAIEAFVLTYRLLTQNNDRYSIQNLARLYANEWMEPEGQARLAEAREGIASYLSQHVQFDFGERPENVGVLMDVVVYGGLAHSNIEKERRLRVWNQTGPGANMVWVEFMAALIGLMSYLLYIRDLNSVALANYFEIEPPRHLLAAEPQAPS